ncbi:MAG: ribonuclease III [Aminivibrio sp.]|jgi:ribonuclease-3
MDYDAWFRGELEKLQQRLGYRFKNPSLLNSALVHSSYANEKGLTGHNERMEFLGDAALELGVSRFLYEEFPDFDEGALTRARAALVCGKSLAEWGTELGLPKLLRTGNSLEQDDGCRPSLCADAAEALFGAVFLDGGYYPLMEVIKTYFMFHSTRKPIGGGATDPKSSLQMAAHEKGLPCPVYEIISASGPAHCPWFSVRVTIGGAEAGKGEGTGKKAAEFAAAEDALLNFLQETTKEK